MPAVPRAVVFAGQDGLAWTASNGPHPGFAAVASAGSGTVVLPNVAAPSGATGSMMVAAGGGAVFGLVQVPSPDALHRATLVTRGSATGGWTFDSGLRANGPGKVACDAAGSRVWVAAWNGPSPQVRLDVVDALSGASTANVVLAGGALNELAVAADGSRAALACGLDLWIVDAGCAVVAHRVLAQATSAVSITGDGRMVAVGGGMVQVLAARGLGYVPAFDVVGNGGELASRVALSGDGRTLAIGWWNAVNGVDVRFDVWDVPTRSRLFQSAQLGVQGGLQNSPEVVRASADGSRAAMGCWGDGTNAPEVMLWDRGANALVLQADLPGSVFALDLDASGTRVVVGMKGSHANQFSGTGEFRMYDTGERELSQLEPAHAGGQIELAAKSNGASGVLFLEGAPSPFPISIAGTSGSLLLRRVGLHVVRVAADANGRADVSMPVVNDPVLVGTFRHVQAAFRVGGAIHFGPTLLHVLIF